MVDPTELVQRIQAIEESIEDALWTSVTDEDYDKALGEYERARERLEAIKDLSGDRERERKRVLSYCLMRINDAMEHL